MLTYDLDRRGKLARYDYLYRCIREDILAGRLTAGEKLPSKRSLASHLQTAVITVQNAYAQLEAEGYLTLSAGADQRSKHVCLTEKGERFVKAHVDRVPEAEAAALGAMTAAERDALIRLTGRYRALFAQKLNCI